MDLNAYKRMNSIYVHLRNLWTIVPFALLAPWRFKILVPLDISPRPSL